MKGMWCGWISGTLAVVLWAGGLLGGSFSTTPGGRTVYDVSQVGGGPDTVSVTADESEVEARDSTAHPEAGNPGTMDGPDLGATSATWRGRHQGFGVAYTLSGTWKGGSGEGDGGTNEWTSHYDYTDDVRIRFELSPDTISVSGTATAKAVLYGGTDETEYTVTLTGVDPEPTTQPVAELSFPEGSSITLTTANRSGTQVVRGDKAGHASVEASIPNVNVDPPRRPIIVQAPTVSYTRIVGLNAVGAAHGYVTIQPTSATYASWEHRLDTLITDQSNSGGVAGTIQMGFNQSVLKNMPGESTIIAEVTFDPEHSDSAEVKGHIATRGTPNANKTLWLYFLGEGIGLRAFPVSIDCQTHQANYDVPATGHIKCVLSNKPDQLSSTIDYSALIQVGAGPRLAATGTLSPTGPTFNLGRNVQPVILPPNHTVRTGTPNATWWYDTDATATVEWLVGASTPGGNVGGFAIPGTTSDITVALP